MKQNIIAMSAFLIILGVAVYLVNFKHNSQVSLNEFGKIPIQTLPIGEKLKDVKIDGNNIILVIAPMQNGDTIAEYTVKVVYDGKDIQTDHLILQEIK